MTIKLITNRWAWALVPTKLGELGNALAWGGGIYGNPASGPHPTGISFGAWKGGASEQGLNGTSHSNNPKHQAQKLHRKTDTHQMKAADSVNIYHYAA